MGNIVDVCRQIFTVFDCFLFQCFDMLIFVSARRAGARFDANSLWQYFPMRYSETYVFCLRFFCAIVHKFREKKKNTWPVDYFFITQMWKTRSHNTKICYEKKYYGKFYLQWSSYNFQQYFWCSHQNVHFCAIVFGILSKNVTTGIKNIISSYDDSFVVFQ